MDNFQRADSEITRILTQLGFGSSAWCNVSGKIWDRNKVREQLLYIQNQLRGAKAFVGVDPAMTALLMNEVCFVLDNISNNT